MSAAQSSEFKFEEKEKGRRRRGRRRKKNCLPSKCLRKGKVKKIQGKSVKCEYRIIFRMGKC